MTKDLYSRMALQPVENLGRERAYQIYLALKNCTEIEAARCVGPLVFVTKVDSLTIDIFNQTYDV